MESPVCVTTDVIGGSLESPWWLLLAFWPKLLGGGSNLQIIVLLKNECSLSEVDNHR